MMLKLVTFLALLCAVSWAQPVNPPQIVYVTSSPAGNPCTATNIQLLTPSGTLYTCLSGVFTQAGGGGGGTGTVTVVGAGNLTSTALVTGGGSQTIQTPAATATMDSSGNISTPGAVSSGVGSGNAGAVSLVAGTDTSIVANSFGFGAPATITTAVRLKPPNAIPGAGSVMLMGTTASNETPFTYPIPSLIYPCVSASASGTTYTCTTGSSVTLATGMMFLWQPDVTCSGTPTLNIDGNGAKTLRMTDTSNIQLALCGVGGSTTILLSYETSVATGLYAVSLPSFQTGNCNRNGGILFTATANTNAVSCNSALIMTAANLLTTNGLAGNLPAGSPAISGCSATIGTGSTNISGFYTAAAQVSPCTVTLTWAAVTYATGANCYVNDFTTPANVQLQTGSTTTTVTISGITLLSDKVGYFCIGY